MTQIKSWSATGDVSQAERGDDDDESEHSESQGDQSSSQPNQVTHTAVYMAIILSHDTSHSSVQRNYTVSRWAFMCNSSYSDLK